MTKTETISVADEASLMRTKIFNHYNVISINAHVFHEITHRTRRGFDLFAQTFILLHSLFNETNKYSGKKDRQWKEHGVGTGANMADKKQQI